MSLHPNTVDVLNSNKDKFSNQVNSSIDTILDLINNNSALSDTGFLLDKHDLTTPGIKLPSEEGSWIPIRNLARLLGKIASLDYSDTVTMIEVRSMRCGCDYFEGEVYIQFDDRQIGGEYKWQWTAFPGRIRSYDQFTKFPEIVENLVAK